MDRFKAIYEELPEGNKHLISAVGNGALAAAAFGYSLFMDRMRPENRGPFDPMLKLGVLAISAMGVSRAVDEFGGFMDSAPEQPTIQQQ